MGVMRIDLPRRSAGLAMGACLAVFVVAPAACGNDRDGFVEKRDVFPEGGAGGPDADGAVCENKLRCSRDLRGVVDACDESRVVSTCSPEQGCADATCVPACEAAARNSASVGCEFAAFPPSTTPNDRLVMIDGKGACFAAFLANTWATTARVEIEYDGAPLDVASSALVVRTSSDGTTTYEPFDGELEPGEAAVLFLGAEQQGGKGCPVAPAVRGDTSIPGTARGPSFRIKTSAPVSAYSIYPFGGAASFLTSATLLLPIASWGTGYVVTTGWWQARVPGDFKPMAAIIAAEDDTDVSITGSVAIQPGDRVEGEVKGVAHTYHLSRGEVMQLAQTEDLSGSVISANKNIAVMGEHECMDVPAGKAACEIEQAQLFPVRSWGYEYAAVPYLSRRTDKLPEDYFYRVVAAVDRTVLTYEAARPSGAPATLDASGSVLFTTREPFVVRSQDADHPIAVYSYMSGVEWPRADLSDGDPEFTPVIATEQYLDRYIFYVDPTYRNSQLVIVRARQDGADFAPVVLDCAGPLDGWQPVGTSGKYEFVRVRLTHLFKPQVFGSGVCTAGRHEITSQGPIGVTVWGTDDSVSYAYPGGAAIRTLNAVEPRVVH